MKKKHPVVHFELPATDSKRMADFYTKVFGWQAQFLGEEMGYYVTVATTDIDGSGRPTTPGAINGGLYPRSDDLSNHPSVVIATDDINESIKEIAAAGGKVLGEPAMIPGVGKFVGFTDTEGNTLSILEPLTQ